VRKASNNPQISANCSNSQIAADGRYVDYFLRAPYLRGREHVTCRGGVTGCQRRQRRVLLQQLSTLVCRYDRHSASRAGSSMNYRYFFTIYHKCVILGLFRLSNIPMLLTAFYMCG